MRSDRQRQDMFTQTDSWTGDRGQRDSNQLHLTRLKSLDSVLWSRRFLTGDLALSLRGEEAWGPETQLELQRWT